MFGIIPPTRRRISLCVLQWTDLRCCVLRPYIQILSLLTLFLQWSRWTNIRLVTGFGRTVLPAGPTCWGPGTTWGPGRPRLPPICSSMAWSPSPTMSTPTTTHQRQLDPYITDLHTVSTTYFFLPPPFLNILYSGRVGGGGYTPSPPISPSDIVLVLVAP